MEKVLRKKIYNWKKYSILQDFWELFFKKIKSTKIDQWHLDIIIFASASKALNSEVPYSNEKFLAFKWYNSSTSLIRNLELKNLMSDVWDIAISKIASLILTYMNQFMKIRFSEKFFFKKLNLRKLIYGSLDSIIFWPTSSAYNRMCCTQMKHWDNSSFGLGIPHDFFIDFLKYF